MFIGEEELMMDVMMKTLGTALGVMDTNSTAGVRMSGGTREEDWLEESFFEELYFEDWVEEELMEMEVTKLVEPLEIEYSEEGVLALGLAMLTPESHTNKNCDESKS